MILNILSHLFWNFIQTVLINFFTLIIELGNSSSVRSQVFFQLQPNRDTESPHCLAHLVDWYWFPEIDATDDSPLSDTELFTSYRELYEQDENNPEIANLETPEKRWICTSTEYPTFITNNERYSNFIGAEMEIWV